MHDSKWRDETGGMSAGATWAFVVSPNGSEPPTVPAGSPGILTNAQQPPARSVLDLLRTPAGMATAEPPLVLARSTLLVQQHAALMGK
jgi:hypothetical protein